MNRLARVLIPSVVALASLAGVAAAEPVKLRMATLAPTGSRWEKTLTEGTEKIKEATAKRVLVEYYADANQGDERDYIRKINLGQLDGAAVTSVGLSMIYEGIKVLELPMMFESVEELDYVRSKMWPYFQGKFAEQGIELGEQGDVGWVYFLSKNKVTTLADLKKQKLWMWSDDRVVKEMYKQLGISGVPLGVPEVAPQLTAGSINACYGPPLAAMTLGWASKVKYMTSMPMAYSIGATVMKKSALDKIDKADLEEIRKISKKVSSTLRKNVRKDNNNARKQMERKGVTLVDTPPEMVAEFRKAAEAVWKSLAGKVYSQKELDMVLKYRDEFRAKNKK